MSDADRDGVVHFQRVASWEEARSWVGYEPRVPSYTQECSLERLRVHVRDHRRREVPLARRSLEAGYGRFSFSQSRPGVDEARRAALEVSYGSAPRVERVGVNEARAYERGPEPAADDPDPRMPAVVVWADGAMFFLVASESLPLATLLEIARSVR